MSLNNIASCAIGHPQGCQSLVKDVVETVEQLPKGEICETLVDFVSLFTIEQTEGQKLGKMALRSFFSNSCSLFSASSPANMKNAKTMWESGDKTKALAIMRSIIANNKYPGVHLNRMPETILLMDNPEELIPILEKIVEEHGDYGVGQDAADAIELINDPTALASYHKYLEALKKAGNSDRYIENLMTAWESESRDKDEILSDLRTFIEYKNGAPPSSLIEAITATGDKALIPILEKIVEEHGDYGVGQDAADAIELINDPAALEAHRKHLEIFEKKGDPYRYIENLMTAWESVSRDKDEILSDLRTFIQHEDSAALSSLIKAITATGDKALIPILEKIAEEHEDHSIGQDAADAIELINDSATLEAHRKHLEILEMIKYPYRYVKDAMTAWESGSRDKDEILSDLQTFIEHEGGAALSSLIKAITATGDKALIPILEKIAEEHGDYSRIGQGVAIAIELINDPAALEAHLEHLEILEKIGNSDRYIENLMTAWESGSRDKDEILSDLQTFIEHEDGAPLSSLIKAITATGDKALIPILKEIIKKHRYRRVGRDAAVAIELINDPAALEAHLEHLEILEKAGNSDRYIENLMTAWELGSRDKDEILSDLQTFIEHEDGAPLSSLIKAITATTARTGDKALIPILEKIAEEHEDHSIGQDAADAIELINDPATLEAHRKSLEILEKIGDPDRYIENLMTAWESVSRDKDEILSDLRTFIEYENGAPLSSLIEAITATTAKTGDKALIPILEKIVEEDGDYWVGQDAADAIELINDPATLEAHRKSLEILEMTKYPYSYVKDAMTAWESGSRDKGEILSDLQTFIEHEDGAPLSLLIEAITATTAKTGDKALIPILEKIAEEHANFYGVGQDAAVAIELINDPAALEAHRKYLEILEKTGDPDRYIEDLMTAWELGSRDKDEILSDLQTFIEYEDGALLSSLIEAITATTAKTGDKALIPILEKIAKKYEYYRVGQDAAATIELINDPAALEAHLEYLEILEKIGDPDRYIENLMTAWESGSRDKDEILSDLRTFIEYENGAPISSLIEAITATTAKTGDKALIPILEKIVEEDGDYGVGQDAAAAIELINDPATLEAHLEHLEILEKIGDPDRYIEDLMTAWESGSRDKDEILSDLRTFIEYEDGAPVSSLIEAVTATGDKALVPILEKIVEEHGDYWVGWDATAAIETIKSD